MSQKESGQRKSAHGNHIRKERGTKPDTEMGAISAFKGAEESKVQAVDTQSTPDTELRPHRSSRRNERSVEAVSRTMLLKPSRGKGRKSESRGHSDVDEGHTEEVSDESVIASELGSDVSRIAHPECQTPVVQTSQSQLRSSGRTRRVPRRFSNSNTITSSPSSISKDKTSNLQKKPTRAEKPNAAFTNPPPLDCTVQSPRPQGILTPSRREQRTRLRKSVVFQEDERDSSRRIEEELGFKDIDVETSRKKQKQRSKGVLLSASTQMPELEVRRNQGSHAVATGRVREQTPLEDEDAESPLETAPNLDEIISLSSRTQDNFDVEVYQAIDEEDEYIVHIKHEILSRITNSTLSSISHLQAQYATLHSLLRATIAAGESNSLLLLGSRGSGKSLLINHALEDLSKSYSADFHVVRLNGFYQTDDKLGLREIWRQLGREMAVPEDETSEVSSYADTMASLLSLLSHPEDLADPDGMILDSDNKDIVTKTAKSVIFVLDEFDLFTTHPRQTLLYNLFDIAQAKKAPIAVLGCTTRMDVVECLEKRVKSRFSHRWLHVTSLKSLSMFEEAVAQVLCLPLVEREGAEKDDIDWRQRWNRFIKVSGTLLL